MKNIWESGKTQDVVSETGRSAGVPPAVAGASRPRFGETIRDRGRLPHWEKEAGTYFITFGLADSLPKSVLDRIESERRSNVATANQLPRALSSDERRKIQQLSTPAIEQFLDTGFGTCHLRNPVIAAGLADRLRHFDRKWYLLFAWCIMPNHAHVVVRILSGEKLDALVHSWKPFSAKQSNRILGSRGAFWQREYYDHLVRYEGEFDRAVHYVAENSAKANLKEWKWVWVRGRDARATAGEDAGATATGTAKIA